MNISGVEQLEAMRCGIDYRFPIVIRKFALDVRPLSIMETVRVAQHVSEELRAVPESARNRLTEHIFLAKQTLIVASTSDVGVNDQKITDYILERMTNDELQFAYNQYVAVIDRANPQLEMLSVSDVEAIIEELKKKSRGRPGGVGVSTDRAIALAAGEHNPLLSDQRRLTHGQVTWWVAHAILSGKLEWQTAKSEGAKR